MKNKQIFGCFLLFSVAVISCQDSEMIRRHLPKTMMLHGLFFESTGKPGFNKDSLTWSRFYQNSENDRDLIVVTYNRYLSFIELNILMADKLHLPNGTMIQKYMTSRQDELTMQYIFPDGSQLSTYLDSKVFIDSLNGNHYQFENRGDDVIALLPSFIRERYGARFCFK